jgi:hypothetical protein
MENSRGSDMETIPTAQQLRQWHSRLCVYPREQILGDAGARAVVDMHLLLALWSRGEPWDGVCVGYKDGDNLMAAGWI